MQLALSNANHTDKWLPFILLVSASSHMIERLIIIGVGLLPLADNVQVLPQIVTALTMVATENETLNVEAEAMNGPTTASIN